MVCKSYLNQLIDLEHELVVAHDLTTIFVTFTHLETPSLVEGFVIEELFKEPGR